MEALLAAHAQSIQVLSTIVTCVATVTLAWLTGRYVRQTKQVASSSIAQVEIMRATLESARSRNGSALRALAQRLRFVAGGLDKAGPEFGRLRNFALVTERDLGDLEGLAKEVGGAAPKLSADAVRALRVILEIRDDASAHSEIMGWLPSDPDVERYRAALHEAELALAALEGYVVG